MMVPFWDVARPLVRMFTIAGVLAILFSLFLVFMLNKNQSLSNMVAQLQALSNMLRAKNQEIETTLQELRTTQDQLVDSEKMAALGQLIAGVAHEVNTPLGVIKASVSSLSISLSKVLTDFPKISEVLSAEELSHFIRLCESFGTTGKELTTREKRALKKTCEEHLESQGFDKPDELAETLLSIGAHEKIEELAPLLKHHNSDYILDMAYRLHELKKNTRNIDLASERASKVIFALKTFARYDHKEEKIHSSVIEGIETIITLYQNQLKKGVEVVREFAFTESIKCYPDELNQVWMNLITNAIQAMDYTGTLTVGSFEKEGSAVYFVKDSGCGIPEEIKDKIFKAFFTTKKAGEGSGLGLDIVKKIIEKHGGRIEFESSAGVGTTFFVHLPKE